VSEYFSNFYLPHYFVPFVLLYGQETQMSADIKHLLLMFCSRVFVWIRLQYTHHGPHYEHMFHRQHGISIDMKELIVALVTAADAMSAALACFQWWQWHWLRRD
jgi:hypothetical protein